MRKGGGRVSIGRFFLRVCAALEVAGLTLSWIAGGLMLKGALTAVRSAPPPAMDLWLRTQDHVDIAATYRPGQRPDAPAVLLLHGINQSRETVAANATWLAGEGYATLTIDFRGHGQSTQRSRSLGWYEAADAHAAFRWLKHHQHGSRVGVIGISMGGAASLLGPYGPLPVDALVLQAVYPDVRDAIRHRIAVRLGSAAAWFLEPLLSFQTRPRLGIWPSVLSPLTALRGYTGPVLIIGGEHDRSTPPSETMALFDAARGPKSLWLVGRGDHADLCALESRAYRSHLLRFFRRTIGG